MTVDADRDTARITASGEHRIDIFPGVVVLCDIVLLCRIVVFELRVSCTERCELVEQPLLAGELEAQHRPTESVGALAIGVLDDVTEQRSQHRRVLEVEELGWDDEVGHASSMADFG